jgi:hypothetical protein
MNETHRGCRSPGGFFFALLLAVLQLRWAPVFRRGCYSELGERRRLIVVAHAWGILWGEALPSIRWFVRMQARVDRCPEFDCLWCSRLLQTGSSYDDAINRRSFTPVRL